MKLLVKLCTRVWVEKLLPVLARFSHEGGAQCSHCSGLALLRYAAGDQGRVQAGEQPAAGAGEVVVFLEQEEAQ